MRMAASDSSCAADRTPPALRGECWRNPVIRFRDLRIRDDLHRSGDRSPGPRLTGLGNRAWVLGAEFPKY